MARPRDYSREYQQRQTRARELGFSGYHQRRYGPTARSSGMGAGPDLDTTSVRRRIHEAVAVSPEESEDWEHWSFDSTRVAAARYSPSRQQLVVLWTNDPSGTRYPSYIYDAIPQPVWTGFTSAGSAGQYVNYALNTYPYRPAPGEMP